MERKIDVTWDGNPDTKENMAGYTNKVDAKMTIDLSGANHSYYQSKAQDDHPWRGKSAFGFATILNRNSCDDMSANGPLSVNLPPLQSYHATNMGDKTKLSAHKVPARPMPTPIAPLGDSSLVDLAALQNRSLKLKIKKKHVDISPAYVTQGNGSGPLLAPSPSTGMPRKLALAPAPSLDDDDDDSGDDDENAANAAHGGAALRGGRWTSEEHERFLQGFRLHGHKWKRVQMVVRSRTVTQVRTHAQKYLLKLQKLSGGPEQRTSGSGPEGERFLAPSQFGSGATSPTQSTTSLPDGDERPDGSFPLTEPVAVEYNADGSVRTPLPAARKLKSMKKQPKRPKRSEIEGSSLIHIEEAAYTLCALMKEHFDDLEALTTDHEDDLEHDEDDIDEDESTENESEAGDSPVSESKKRYLCRKCRVPKKGHVCPDASSGEESSSKLSLQKMSLHEDADAGEPLVADWQHLDQYLGHSVVRCFGPNVWCRGRLDQVVRAADCSEQDQIRIVYAEAPLGAASRHEWLLKSDAIECVALAGLNDDATTFGVFSGSSLKKRKLWQTVASNLMAVADLHPAKRLCSP
ncbi:hypothetical protein ACHHYP_11658 [Achlya hypogyna]|uniref:Uncharacterized protein n=1 Tax=Achlya hypogyna TaxID=1202772 RepID=A0A1V9YIP6_ACHHY|nr:hypothetical protein ACHHYP_11658 [Achlya hypogyna]